MNTSNTILDAIELQIGKPIFSILGNIRQATTANTH